MPKHANRAERGQTLPLIAVFMTVLLGMCALAVDVGGWTQDRQSLRAATDAAALAGASALPQGWAAAQTAAANEYAQNGKPGDSVTYALSTNLTSDDSVNVTATRVSSSYFARIFGNNSATLQATARATIESFTTVASHQDIMPWGVMKNSFVPGQPYSIYTDNSSSNNGALSLPYVNNASCPVPSGANPYRDEIDGALNSCPVSTGEMLDVKPGQNAGPTRQGIDARITTWETVSQVASIDGSGNATILDPTCKQLVLIPIVEDPNGGTNWLNGSGQVRVIGFAYFVITPAPGYTQNGKTVTGIFIKTDDTSEVGDTTGSYVPGADGDTVPVLTA